MTKKARKEQDYIRRALCRLADEGKISADFDSFQTAIQLQELAARADRYNTLRCTGGITDRQEKTAQNIDNQARQIVEALGLTFTPNGDPRGPAFTLTIGTEEIGVCG